MAAMETGGPAAAAGVGALMLYYGPCRLSELTKPRPGFQGIIAILEPFSRIEGLIALRERNPGAQIIPELALAGKPADFKDNAAWDRWTASILPWLTAIQGAGFKTVCLNAENESAASQRQFWLGDQGFARKRGAALGKKLRQMGFEVWLDALPEYEDPKWAAGGSKVLGFVPFAQGLAPDVFLNGDGSGGNTAKVQEKTARKVLGARKSIPQIWLTRHHIGDAANLAHFQAGIKDALASGACCIAPENNGDVSDEMLAILWKYAS